VVVGDLIGSGSAQEQSVAGETPCLATRLQTRAPPGGVVIASSTRQLLGSEFNFVDLGPQDLKGFAEPVAAWHVLGTRVVESRFEARSTGAARGAYPTALPVLAIFQQFASAAFH
jgi:class 3 adenylate cyclase